MEKAKEMKNIHQSGRVAEIHEFINVGFNEIENELSDLKGEVLVRQQLSEVASSSIYLISRNIISTNPVLG